MRVVAGAGGADVHAAARDVVADNAPGGLLAAVHGVVLPEPGALHHVAVGGGVIVGAGVGVDEARRLLDAPDRSVALDVLGVVEADVGVRRLENVDRPLPRGRRPRRKVRLGNERKVLRAVAVPKRNEAPAVTGDKRMGNHLRKSLCVFHGNQYSTEQSSLVLPAFEKVV